MSDALVKLAKDSAGNPPQITVEDFKAIDLDARKEILNCTPEEVIDRIHQAQKIINTQKIRLAAFCLTIIDWHEKATKEERQRIADHDRKYQVQTVIETTVEKRVSLSPEEKMLKKLTDLFGSEEKAKEFIANQKKAL